MKKPTMLYVSPLWPMRSGISEYSEALLQGLKDYYDITLLLDHYRVEHKELEKQFSIRQYGAHKNYGQYDYILYNFGNNPEFHSYMYEMLPRYPGYVILHDYILYYLTVSYYEKRRVLFQKIYEIEGINGIQKAKASLKTSISKSLLEHKDLAAELPLNWEVIEAAKGIFVHSQYSRNKIVQKHRKKDVFVIPLVQTIFDNLTLKQRKYDLRKENGIPQEAFVVGSAGLIAPSKQNVLACQSVEFFNRVHKEKIYYVMIGDGGYADSYLGEYIKKTGFLENKDYFKAISQCNMIFNLRYPYNGEASATLNQCMELSRPCVVTNIGWFGELPEGCVEKVDRNILPGELAKVIERFQFEDLGEMIEKAYRYVTKECSPAAVAQVINRSI